MVSEHEQPRGYSEAYLKAGRNGDPNKAFSVQAISETLYAVRRTPSGNIRMAKFVDGSPWPVDTYNIVGSRCDCFGASRHSYCKHVKILEVLRKHQEAGLIVVGAFYDADRDLLYTPSDNEGIPLDGAVHIEPTFWVL